MIGAHCIKSFAKTLPVIALSSGEAELMAIVKGTTEAMGIKALLADLGMEVRLAVRSDATAAIGIVSRLGLGKVRHLAVSDLWVQKAARSGVVEYFKIPGQLNPADLFTKALDCVTMMMHAERIGQQGISGRAQTAPCRRSQSKCSPEPIPGMDQESKIKSQKIGSK